MNHQTSNMVLEVNNAETYQMSMERKRKLSGAELKHQEQQTTSQSMMTSAGTQTEPKRSMPTIANNGWGELFKDRATFVEMHLC